MEKSTKKLSSDKLPKKNILVLSCIDLRLTDELVNFLNQDNLQNRYDHFILAGASLFCTEKHTDLLDEHACKDFACWKTMLEQHLKLAIDLHKIRDVYIVEHQDCGAYTNFLKNGKGKFPSIKIEKQRHNLFATELADRIHQQDRVDKYIEEDKDLKEFKVIETFKLGVHCFFIDLRGNVELLYSVEAKSNKNKFEL